MRQMVVLVLVACLGAGGALAQAPARAPENTGPNVNIERWARGTYAYRGLADGRDRGWERFQMFVHRDGSRTMLMWHDLRARNAQFTVVLRVGADFAPIDAFVDYWTANGHKGTGRYRAVDGGLEQGLAGPSGYAVTTLPVTGAYSLGSHPVSADGWHRPAMVGDGLQAAEARVVSVEATPDLAKPMAGTLDTLALSAAARESITTPAGTFETISYMLGDFRVWATGPDHLLVRMVQEQYGLEYILTELDTGP